MNRWLIALLVASLSACTTPQPDHIALDADWELDGVGPATVPGHVLLELVRTGRVPDPFLGTNEGAAQWVEDSTWTYRLVFETPNSWDASDPTHLVFEGLDTYARVLLDGTVLLEADNAHRTWCTDPFPAGSGRHVLEVQFDPVAVRGAAELAAAEFVLPCSNEARPIGAQTSPYTRKAGYQFGWDWGPRLAGPGIAGTVTWVNGGGPPEVPWCEVLTATADEARVAVHGRADWELEGAHRWDGDTLVFDAPALWWPRGMGEAALHALRWRHPATGAERTVMLGLRTIEWVREADAFGPAFALRVNGVPVQARGANTVPPDFFTARAAGGWDALVRVAAAAHMNTLRVWGGGGYPPEAFYAACDREGVLVWQDFAFACAMVPGSEAFRENVAAEAAEQVRRVRHHPCLALWCGNNEVELAWERWNWQETYGLHGADSAAVAADYAAVFDTLLPGIVAAESAAAYWPSSPHAEGDEHAWGVWFGREDFAYYSRHGGRFASEYGLQSLPDRHTLREAGVEAFGDSALQYRQRSRMDWLEPGFDGWDMMQHFMGKTVGLPADGDLDQWIFLSQTTQALGLQQALERHRTSAGRVSGSLYWSLNDVWPAVSWSTVDWAGRWKLGHYAARRANAPRCVLWQRERTDSLVLLAFNDGPVAWRDSVQLELKTPDGAVRQSATRGFNVPAHGSVALGFGPMADWQADPGHTYLAWHGAGERATALWSMPIEFHRPPGPVAATATASGLEVHAPFYEPVVGLAADVPGHFRENGFALEAGERLQVEFVPEEAPPTAYTVRTLGHPEGIAVSTEQARPKSAND